MRAAIAAVVLLGASSVAAQPAPPPPPVLACAAPKQPLFVFTENFTPTNHDVCAAYHRATAKMSFAAIPAGQVTMRIRLDAITNRVSKVGCNVHVDVYTQRGLLASYDGTGMTAFTHSRDAATSDCIDALIQHLVEGLEKPTVAALAAGPLPPPRTAPPRPPAPSPVRRQAPPPSLPSNP